VARFHRERVQRTRFLETQSVFGLTGEKVNLREQDFNSLQQPGRFTEQNVTVSLQMRNNVRNQFDSSFQVRRVLKPELHPLSAE